jgi:aspartyl-tRNA(Asn)/glutamyl-tRNA(Gln) amidotransferase subunit B
VIGLEIHLELDTNSKLFCSCSRKPGKRGEPWVKEYLEKKAVDFTYVEHNPVTKPVDSAKARGVELKQIAKALLYVYDKKNPVLVILSGDRKVDETKLKQALDSSYVELATPDEVKKHTSCVVGLVPPTIDGVKKIIDKRLLENDILSFNAGSSTAGIKISKDELLKVLDDYSVGEVSHDELLKQSGARTGPSKSEAPNTRTCPTCLGMPGSKPVLNKKALEFGLQLALALNCGIAPHLVFSRKSYFYPDLAKNYQITQYELPLGSKGKLEIGDDRTIRITRVHLEEDPAALVHPTKIGASAYVLADYNRSGNPLCEIVTEPDMESPDQARAFMKRLISVANYLGIFDINTCIIKADANVSIKKSGYIRSEIKNVTGFKEIERALNYEVERQEQAIKNNEKLVLDTRSWDPVKGVTTRLRTKETEADYAYILDPDLVETELPKSYIEKIRSNLPELARDKEKKFVEKYKLNKTDAFVLAQEKSLAELFEKLAESFKPAFAVRWIRHEVMTVLNTQAKTWAEVEATEDNIIELLTLVHDSKITDLTARDLLSKLIEKPFSIKDYIKEHGLEVVSDTNELTELCKQVIKEEPKAVEDFKAGEPKAFNRLIGKVMKATKGKASPKELAEIMKSLI